MSGGRLWIFTPGFAEAWRSVGHRVPSGAHLLNTPEEPAKQLALFRQQREAGAEAVTILDLGRIPEGQAWAYISDAVNKSGSNPLRGMTDRMRDPFIDVTTLYHRPVGTPGLEVIALGNRYGDEMQMSPACGVLHHMALVAHAEGFHVTGILVDKESLASLDPAAFIGG